MRVDPPLLLFPVCFSDQSHAIFSKKGGNLNKLGNPLKLGIFIIQIYFNELHFLKN